MFLGIDLSTQGLKMCLLDDRLVVANQTSVSFQDELAEFGTVDGVVHHSDGKTITSPTLMWVKAVDLLLEKTGALGVDFSAIKAVSFSGQQHGSVYWRRGSLDVLRALPADESLHCQLSDCFEIDQSPIWMDSSTTEFCQRLHRDVGSGERLAQLTGACAYERYTGTQIAKIVSSQPQHYHQVERISLVSSFICSLFLQDYAPIDAADGSGMALLDLTTGRWNDRCLASVLGLAQSEPKLAAEPIAELKRKLGPDPVDSCSIVGRIGQYFVDKYGFSQDCKVVAGTGDNPATLAGLGLRPGHMAITMGTSDCSILWLTSFRATTVIGYTSQQSRTALPQRDVSLSQLVTVTFANPIQRNHFMALTVFKNSSLARDRIRQRLGIGSWQQFEMELAKTEPGNSGNLGLYYFVPEISPLNVAGEFKTGPDGQPVDSFSKEVEVRAIIEGQAIARRYYAERLGFKTGQDGARILATGGASQNSAILQIFSDVFATPIYTCSIVNSACLGAAVQAARALARLNGSDQAEQFEKTAEASLEGSFQCVARPRVQLRSVYDRLFERYCKFEESLLV